MDRRRLALAASTLVLSLALALPAVAGTRIDQSLDLAPGERFSLDADSGSVTILGGSGSGARIAVTSDADDLRSRYDFEFKREEGGVRVTARRKGGWLSSMFRSDSLRFDVEVPTRTRLDVGTGGGKVVVQQIEGDVELETAGGPIEVSTLDGKLAAKTSGGPITLRDVEGDAGVQTSGGPIEATSVEGSLVAETSGGPITLDRVTGDVDARTSGGPIRVTSAGGRVLAKTLGGHVEVGFVRGNGRGGEIETMGGGIRVAVDPSADLTLDAETAGGKVSTTLPLRPTGSNARSSLEGSLGKGGPTLVLRTMGGSIRIEGI